MGGPNRRVAAALVALLPLCLAGTSLAQSLKPLQPRQGTTARAYAGGFGGGRGGSTGQGIGIRPPVIDLARQAELRRPGQVLPGDATTAFNVPEPVRLPAREPVRETVIELGVVQEAEAPGAAEAAAMRSSELAAAPGGSGRASMAGDAGGEIETSAQSADIPSVAEIGADRTTDSQSAMPPLRVAVAPAPETDERVTLPTMDGASVREDVAAPGETGSRVVTGDAMGGAVGPATIARRDEEYPEPEPRQDGPSQVALTLPPARREIDEAPEPAGRAEAMDIGAAEFEAGTSVRITDLGTGQTTVYAEDDAPASRIVNEPLVALHEPTDVMPAPQTTRAAEQVRPVAQAPLSEPPVSQLPLSQPIETQPPVGEPVAAAMPPRDRPVVREAVIDPAGGDAPMRADASTPVRAPMPSLAITRATDPAGAMSRLPRDDSFVPSPPVDGPSMPSLPMREAVIELNDPETQPASVVQAPLFDPMRAGTDDMPEVIVTSTVENIDGTVANVQWRPVGGGAGSSGIWSSVRVGAALGGDIEVRTGIGVSVTIRLDDRASVRVERLSKVTIRRAAGDSGIRSQKVSAEIELTRGRVEVLSTGRSADPAGTLARVITPDQTIELQTGSGVEYNAFTGTRRLEPLGR